MYVWSRETDLELDKYVNNHPLSLKESVAMYKNNIKKQRWTREDFNLSRQCYFMTQKKIIIRSRYLESYKDWKKTLKTFRNFWLTPNRRNSENLLLSDCDRAKTNSKSFYNENYKEDRRIFYSKHEKKIFCVSFDIGKGRGIPLYAIFNGKCVPSSFLLACV